MHFSIFLHYMSYNYLISENKPTKTQKIYWLTNEVWGLIIIVLKKWFSEKRNQLKISDGLSKTNHFIYTFLWLRDILLMTLNFIDLLNNPNLINSNSDQTTSNQYNKFNIDLSSGLNKYWHIYILISICLISAEGIHSTDSATLMTALFLLKIILESLVNGITKQLLQCTEMLPSTDGL